MISASEFVAALRANDIGFVAGVPCSYFGGPISLLERQDRLTYVPSANEGTALAAAAGASLGGVSSAVLLQNSGFGNLINPLTSLALPYGIPIVVFMSMRGAPVCSPGEPQHYWMGRVAEQWLRSMDIPVWKIAADDVDASAVIDTAAQHARTHGVTFVLVGKGAVGLSEDASVRSSRGIIERTDFIAALLDELTDEAVISTTGFLSRSLFNGRDRDLNLYMQGSMGHASSIALGVAVVRPDRRCVVLDGDGAALMHLGALSTIGHAACPNITHLIFDNGAYESTGAQITTAGNTDFALIARASGYRAAYTVADTGELPTALRRALHEGGPTLVHVRGRSGGPAGSRASESVDVRAMAQRFSNGLRVGSLP